ncbi:carbohydrate ABC transporter permease [Microbacterium sp. STN6]|uniref:carbohydrate ABC transporter permease n=1 Tax=Microbacterium sp. STN6 TaxID=2995588 RepID=UPI002260E113|nr:carbohydrate ABC transporter permease [Microbacterium sp. STN6]MCX7522977.1 carbohydrate ABC transporter permease [Microbacterium sp. STN6]
MITRREAILNYVILGFFALLSLTPIVGVVLTALTPTDQASATFTIPSRLDFGNFVTAWNQGHFSQYMLSSIIVTLTTVAIASVLSILAGFAFARMRFAGSQVLFYLLIIGLFVPLETYIIPLYYEMRGIELTDTYAALILPQIAQSVAFGVFWMRTFFAAVPNGLIEAARLDGARESTLLWRILVPTARPAIITMVMLTFMWTWNDFLLSLVMITSEQFRTAPLALSFFQSQFVTQYALLSAAATIVALPLIILYAFLQRYFIRGMLAGAIKE